MHKVSFRNKMSTKRQKTGRISQRQFKRMIDFMEKNIAVAHGTVDLSKRQIKKKWEELAEILNAITGANNMNCKKTADQWRKCWRDKKNGVKNKIRMRNPCPDCSKEQGLNQLEKRILNLFPTYMSEELDASVEWNSHEFCQCERNDRCLSPDSESNPSPLLSQPVKDINGVLFCPVIDSQESCSNSSSKDQFLLKQQLNDVLNQPISENNQIKLYPVLENGQISNIPSCSTTQLNKSILNFEMVDNFIMLNDVLLAPTVMPSSEPVSSSPCVKDSTSSNNNQFVFTSDLNKALVSNKAVSLLLEGVNCCDKIVENEVSKMDSVFQASVIDEIKKLPMTLQNKDANDKRAIDGAELSKYCVSVLKTNFKDKVPTNASVSNEDNFNDIEKGPEKSLSDLADSNIFHPVLQETEISSNTPLSSIQVTEYSETIKDLDIGSNSNFDNLLNSYKTTKHPKCAFVSKLENFQNAKNGELHDDDAVLSDTEVSSTPFSEEFVLQPQAKSLENKNMTKVPLNNQNRDNSADNTASKKLLLKEDSSQKMLIKETTKLHEYGIKRKLEFEDDTKSIKRLMEHQNKVLAIIAEASQKRAEEAARQTDILLQLVQEVKKLSKCMPENNA